MPFQPANTEAEARGQAPPVILVDDGTNNVRQHQLEPYEQDRDAAGYDPFRAMRMQSRWAGFWEAFTLRWFDHWAVYWFNGQHGVIARVDGTPVGQQDVNAGTVRAVFRPVPDAWDSGFYGR
jgi:hypothetical protein